MENKTVQHPCVLCIYRKQCGNTNRTVPCKGRTTKTDKKKEMEVYENGN